MRVNALSEARAQVAPQAGQQLGLAVKVVMHQARRNPGFGCHRCNRGPGVAVICKHPGKGYEDVGPTRITVAGSSHRLVV